MVRESKIRHSSIQRFCFYWATPIDEQLLTRMKNGDSSALEIFYDRHAPRILGMLVRMLPSRGDADDVLQEVFWQVWRRAEKYDKSRGKPITWLSIIARYQAIDWLRRYKSTVNTETSPELTSSDQPNEALEKAESAQLVKELLNKLPDEQKTAVCLSYYDGIGHQEIAARLEVPLGTVKTRIRLGMKKLKELVVAANLDLTTDATRGATL